MIVLIGVIIIMVSGREETLGWMGGWIGVNEDDQLKKTRGENKCTIKSHTV